MLLVSNWKAYVEDLGTAKALVAAGKRAIAKSKVQQIIAPPAPFLGLFAGRKVRKSKKLSFGAQDVSSAPGSAATGEVTAPLLASLGATHVIVGHSERRAMGEVDEMVLVKAQQAMAAGLTPILCIGEREHDAEAKYLQFLRGQLDAVLSRLSPKERARLVIAYEPIWAIGKNGQDAIHPSDLHEMVLYIRKVVAEYVPSHADKIQILYGGSVEPSNIRELAEKGQVQGFLVGRASTDVASYTALIKALG